MNNRICREKEVLGTLGISRSTLWRWEYNGTFPRRRRIGPGIIGWLESEVQEWINSRLPVTTPENRKVIT